VIVKENSPALGPAVIGFALAFQLLKTPAQQYCACELAATVIDPITANKIAMGFM
jgi:hypothetical protein